jgi:hypothetical protein
MRDSSRESSGVAGGHQQTHPPAYKTRNWPAYNEALKRRGSLTIWFDPEMSWEAAPTGNGAEAATTLESMNDMWRSSGALDDERPLGGVGGLTCQAWVGLRL